MSDAPRILTIDPGVATGLSVWQPNPDEGPYATILPRIEAEDFVADRLGYGEKDAATADIVIIETFVISQATAKKSRAGAESIEMIGLVRWMCRRQNITLVESRPSDAMNFATDEKLKRIGWYVPGPDHARDALRHLLMYCAEHGFIDPVQLLRRSD